MANLKFEESDRQLVTSLLQNGLRTGDVVFHPQEAEGSISLPKHLFSILFGVSRD
jgi:hypothetical protein